ncbi:MAG: hypothetical protein U1E65_19455 [Myxococcota bacterium]
MTIRFLPLLLLLGLSAPAFAEEGPESDDTEAERGWERPMYERISVSRAVRPLTIKHRVFDVWAGAGAFTVTHVFDGTSPATTDNIALDVAAGLRYGARYGFTDDSELAAELFPMTFTNGLLVNPPTLVFTQRLLRADFQLGISVASMIPVGGFWFITGRVPMQLRLGSALQLWLRPEAGAVASPGDAAFTARVPLGLVLQLARPFWVGASGGALLIGADRLSIPVSVELGATISGQQGAYVDLVLTGELRKAVTRMYTVFEHNSDQWSVVFAAHFYVPVLAAETMEDP